MSSSSSGPSSFELFTPLEQQFEAESTLVTIEPNFKMPQKLEFITSSFGPFLPGLQAVVPLWLAVILKENQQCRIISPPWLLIDALEQTLNDEIREAGFSNSLPYHYVEIAEILLRHARDDLSSSAAGGASEASQSSGEGGSGSDRVQWLIDQIQSRRDAKLAIGTKDFFTTARAFKPSEFFELANIGALETNVVREGLTKAMDIIFEFYRQSIRRKKTTFTSSSSDFSFRATKESSDLGPVEEETAEVAYEFEERETINEAVDLAALIQAKVKARAALGRSNAAADADIGGINEVEDRVVEKEQELDDIHAVVEQGERRGDGLETTAPSVIQGTTLGDIINEDIGETEAKKARREPDEDEEEEKE